MKRLIFFLFAAFMANATFAQTDIKAFDRIGPDAVLDKFRALNFYSDMAPADLTWTENDGELFLESKKGEYLNPTVVISEGTYRLTGFETTSSEFRFLTDYVSRSFSVLISANLNTGEESLLTIVGLRGKHPPGKISI